MMDAWKNIVRFAVKSGLNHMVWEWRNGELVSFVQETVITKVRLDIKLLKKHAKRSVSLLKMKTISTGKKSPPMELFTIGSNKTLELLISACFAGRRKLVSGRY